MEIEVILMPTEKDIIHAAAIAKTSYHNENYESFKDMKYEDAVTFLVGLIDKGHRSALEPLEYIFNITGVSRVLTHELVRKRIGFSYMQKSLRRRRKFDPKSMILKKEVEKDRDIYEEVAAFCIEKYNFLIDKRKNSPDEARRIIPPGLPTEITFTCNARSLRHFLKQRLDKAANWEIRKLAAKIASILIAEGQGFLIRDVLQYFNEREKK